MTWPAWFAMRSAPGSSRQTPEALERKSVARPRTPVRILRSHGTRPRTTSGQPGVLPPALIRPEDNPVQLDVPSQGQSGIFARHVRKSPIEDSKHDAILRRRMIVLPRLEPTTAGPMAGSLRFKFAS